MHFLELTLGTPLGAGWTSQAPPREAIERAPHVSVDHAKRSFLASSHLSDSSHVTHMSHFLLLLTKTQVWFYVIRPLGVGRSAQIWAAGVVICILCAPLLHTRSLSLFSPPPGPRTRNGGREERGTLLTCPSKPKYRPSPSNHSRPIHRQTIYHSMSIPSPSS